MSENQSANAETPPAKVEGEPQVNPASERLLEESKQWKARAMAAEKAKADFEKNALKEKEDYKSLYEKEKNERESLYKQVVQEKLKSKITEVAAKAGCVDVDLLIKAGNKELLQFDENSFELHGADHFVEEVKKSKPFLFSAPKTQTVNPAVPGGVTKEKINNSADISKMNPSEKAKYWAQFIK